MAYFWNSRWHKAKKQYRCEYCGKVIDIGEKYSRETGMYEGDFNDYCLCERCRNIMSDMKDTSVDYELRSFADDLFNIDMTECPKCGSINSREYDFADDMMSIKLECDRCDHVYTVDLSEAAIKQWFAKKNNP